MTEVGMVILQSDQDLILGLFLPVVGRKTRCPLVPPLVVGRTAGGPLVPLRMMGRMTGGALAPLPVLGRMTGGPLVPLQVVGRTTGCHLVPGRMVEVQMLRKIRHLPDLRALGTKITVLQGLAHGHTGMKFRIFFIVLYYFAQVISILI